MGVQHLPESLGEAIEEIALKRDEWLDYRTQVTPWELRRYLPTV